MELLAILPNLIGAQQLFQMFGRATPAVFAVGPSLIGVILYFGLRLLPDSRARWACFVPLVVGIVLGLVGQGLLRDVLFTAMNDFGTITTALYWGMLIVPILTGIGLVVFDRISGGFRDQSL